MSYTNKVISTSKTIDGILDCKEWMPLWGSDTVFLTKLILNVKIGELGTQDGQVNFAQLPFFKASNALAASHSVAYHCF